MGILYSLIAIFGESFTTILDRLNFKRTRINPMQLMSLIFLSMSVSLCLFIFVTHQPFPHLTSTAFGFMALIALVSFSGNAFDYLSLKVDDLSLREPLADFEPIAAGLVGYVAFSAERRPSFLIAFLLSLVIVYWGTHRRKLRRVQSKGMLFMLVSVCIYALQPSIYKVALNHLTPAYLTLFRVVSILLLTLLFFPSARKLHKLSTKKVGYSAASGAVCSVGAVASLYAISKLGVALTMLIMLLGPAIRYLAGYFLLGEKVRRGEVISSVLLVAIVLTAVAI